MGPAFLPVTRAQEPDKQDCLSHRELLLLLTHMDRQQTNSAAQSATPLRELHEKSGARFSTWFGCELPEVFSDTAEEYCRAREAVALFDTGFRCFFELAGADRVRYLNAISSGDIKELSPGRGAIGLLLNPQGHILAELETFALADRLLVLSHALVRRRTAETLEKFIIMDDVTLDDATDRLASIAVAGPRAAELLRALADIDLGSLAEFAHAEVKAGAIPYRVVRRAHFGEPGMEIIVERSRVVELWETLLSAVSTQGGGPIGYAALNALRLEAGIPWFGHDFDDRFIPHEAALENSHISYTKGCYTGQEIVERVRSRGQVNRRRVGLQFSGSAAPAPGTPLNADGKEAGFVTSAAFSPALGTPIGMGYLRREYNAVDSTLEYSEGTATIIALPVRM